MPIGGCRLALNVLMLMLRYIVNRLLLMIPTLLGVAVLVFFLLRSAPATPVQMMFEGANVPQHVLDAERARLGLDQAGLRAVLQMVRGGR